MIITACMYIHTAGLPTNLTHASSVKVMHDNQLVLNVVTVWEPTVAKLSLSVTIATNFSTWTIADLTII